MGKIRQTIQRKDQVLQIDQNGLPTGTITITHTIRLNGDNEYSGSGTPVFGELDGSTFSVEFDTEGRRLSAAPQEPPGRGRPSKFHSAARAE